MTISPPPRKTITVALLAFVLTPWVLAQPDLEGRRPSVTQWLTNTTRPVVIAHRGCWQFAPENSLKGIGACIRLGVDMAEADVRTTKDGTLVMMHDPTLDRMTNMTGALKGYTYEELTHARLRDGGGGPGAEMTSERIPSLAEFLRTAKGHLYLLLHINDADVNQVFDVVSAVGAGKDVVFLWDVWHDSSDLRHAKFIGRSAFIPIVIECTSGRTTGCYTEKEFRLGRAAADYDWCHPVGYLTASENGSFLEIAATAKWPSKFQVMANLDENSTNGPEEVWARYMQWGVPMILTDQAKPLIDYLEARGAR